MELFLPSILILLLAGILIFAVFPNMPPVFLAVIAVGILIAAGYHHHILFKEEYARSTWQDSVYVAATPFFVAVLVIFMIGYLLNFMGGGKAGAAAPSANSGPRTASGPKNFTTAQRQALESLIRNP